MSKQSEKERQKVVGSPQELDLARDNSPVVSNPDSEIHAKPFDIMVYHVTDRHGTHRFLTMNSRSVWFSEGREGFERVLARQYKTFELVGSSPVSFTTDDPQHYTIMDPLGARQIRQRIIDLMRAFPNASNRLEAWMPDPEERVEYPPPEPVRSPWRPMSTLKQEVGKIEDLGECGVVFADMDICEVVEPEFVDTARARGAALLRELKEDVRRKVEPSILRALEGQAEASDR